MYCMEIIKKRGFKNLLPRKVPFLTPAMKEKRLQWCLKNRSREWSNVIFTDESSFQNFRNTIKLWGKKRYLKMKSKTRKQIMVWGGISLRGTTPLKHVFGSINSDKYIEILNECLIPTCETLYPDG